MVDEVVGDLDEDVVLAPLRRVLVEAVVFEERLEVERDNLDDTLLSLQPKGLLLVLSLHALKDGLYDIALNLAL